MTLIETISLARKILADNNVEDASLESELLMRHILKLSRVQLYQNYHRGLSTEEEKLFWDLVERRLNHEPTAYILGYREFYGLSFRVDCRVLIPRPESELLVEKPLGLAQTCEINTIAEIGTGCGAIAISLALNLPQARIYATDISTSALEIARANCRKHGVLNRVHLLQGDMLDPLTKPVDLIIANLPYVKCSDLTELTEFEPALALDGGTDGLEKIRQLCLQAGDKLNPGGHLLLEIGQGQGQDITFLLRRFFPTASIEITPDLSGIERLVSLTLATFTRPPG